MMMAFSWLPAVLPAVGRVVGFGRDGVKSFMDWDRFLPVWVDAPTVVDVPDEDHELADSRPRFGR